MSSGFQRGFPPFCEKKISGLSRIKSDTSPSVISVLEEALALAKSGDLQECLLVGITHDNVAVNGYSHVKSVYTMLGALTQAVTDYQNREIEQYKPDIL